MVAELNRQASTPSTPRQLSEGDRFVLEIITALVWGCTPDEQKRQELGDYVAEAVMSENNTAQVIENLNRVIRNRVASGKLAVGDEL